MLIIKILLCAYIAGKFFLLLLPNENAKHAKLNLSCSTIHAKQDASQRSAQA